MESLEEKFKDAIVSKLVIENKQSIHYATKECAEIAEEFADKQNKEYRDAVDELCRVIVLGYPMDEVLKRINVLALLNKQHIKENGK